MFFVLSLKRNFNSSVSVFFLHLYMTWYAGSPDYVENLYYPWESHTEPQIPLKKMIPTHSWPTPTLSLRVPCTEHSHRTHNERLGVCHKRDHLFQWDVEISVGFFADCRFTTWSRDLKITRRIKNVPCLEYEHIFFLYTRFKMLFSSLKRPYHHIIWIGLHRNSDSFGKIRIVIIWNFPHFAKYKVKLKIEKI